MPNSPFDNMRCGNCRYHNKHDSMCPEGHATHGDSCKNWEPEENDELEDRLVFGGTSLSEIMQKQGLAASITQQLLVCKHKSYEVGWFMAQLTNMYEAACQHMPSMKTEWGHVKSEIEKTIREHWKYAKQK